MSDYLPAILLILIAFVWLAQSATNARLKSTEAKLDALLRHFGVAWEQFSEPSERVKELARDPGAYIEAIKAYRQQTGLGLKEAKKVVDSLAA